MQTDLNYTRGLDYLCRVEGTLTPTTLDALRDHAPDLADMAIRFVYGEVYNRGGLSLRQRQMVTVAALAALGNATPQLKFHLSGALHVGCTPTEVVETLIHLVIYAGFPASLNALSIAKEVFGQKGIQPEPNCVRSSETRYEQGWEALQRIDGHAGEKVIDSLRNLAPDLARFIVEFSFGDIYTRPGMTLVDREIVTVAALTALGTASSQLKVHVHGLLNVGGTQEQAVETAIHLAAYAGFPAAINAVLAIKDVLTERHITPP